MKKYLFGLLATIAMVSCTDDVNTEPRQSIRIHSNQLDGIYDAVTPDDDFGVRFTYNYLDSASNTSLNLYDSEVSPMNFRTYEFVEVISINGVSTWEIRMYSLQFIDSTAVTGSEVMTFEVLDFELEDNLVTSLDVVTPSGTPTSLTRR